MKKRADKPSFFDALHLAEQGEFPVRPVGMNAAGGQRVSGNARRFSAQAKFLGMDGESRRAGLAQGRKKAADADTIDDERPEG